jgi:uncharacterized ubiquitin-like protein YukD
MSAPYALKVAYGRETIELNVAPDTSVKVLKDLIAERCSALARNMRLISKGKTLADKDTLAGAGLSDGAKLMMLAGGAPVVSAVRNSLEASARLSLLTLQERRARLRCLLRAELERPLSPRRHRSLLAEQPPATPLGPQRASSRCATLGSQRCPARCGRWAALRVASTCAATHGLAAWGNKSLRSAT